MTTYSAFFSSGLLAPHHAYSYDASPMRPSSPLPVPSSPIRPDECERSTTPTPTPTTDSTAPISTRPRLRKRRSSLTVACSPMNTIKSPSRSAGLAFRHAMSIASPTRSRSGSLSAGSDVFGGYGGYGAVATEGTSLVGRMRSGSVSGGMRPRRTVRRTTSTPVPAAAPPPTAPLPPVPSLSSTHRQPPHTAPPAFHQRPPLTQHARVPSSQTRFGADMPTKSPMVDDEPQWSIPTRDRAYSVNNGYWIDEEMKEN